MVSSNTFDLHNGSVDVVVVFFVLFVVIFVVVVVIIVVVDIITVVGKPHFSLSSQHDTLRWIRVPG